MITKLQFCTTILLGALFTPSSALFGEWTAWSTCNKPCNGEQQRTRSCQTITLQPCEEKTQTRICNISGCYPSAQVIIICAVLGVLILLFLVVLIVLLIKTRRFTNEQTRENVVMDFEKFSNGNIHKSKETEGQKRNVERTLSGTPSTVSQITHLAPVMDAGPTDTAVKPWGQQDCDLY